MNYTKEFPSKFYWLNQAKSRRNYILLKDHIRLFSHPRERAERVSHQPHFGLFADARELSLFLEELIAYAHDRIPMKLSSRHFTASPVGKWFLEQPLPPFSVRQLLIVGEYLISPDYPYMITVKSSLSCRPYGPFLTHHHAKEFVQWAINPPATSS